MRFKPRSEHNEHRHSERSRGTPLRQLEDQSREIPRPRKRSGLGMTISMSLEKVIEALLFSAQKPLSIHEITAAIKGAEGDQASETPNEFARVKNAEVAAALEQLKVEYIQQSRAFQLVEKAEGWQLATDPGFAKWVRQLFPAPKPARLSAPALETLAIIAYRQPITRADVEAVRGVNIDGVLQTLMERGLVKIAGRAEIPGRPLLYETTQFFLDHFGLRNLDELPNAEELRRRYLPVAQPVTPATHRRCGVARASSPAGFASHRSRNDPSSRQDHVISAAPMASSRSRGHARSTRDACATQRFRTRAYSQLAIRICGNPCVGLRACCKILREQAWQCGAGNAKWPDNFRALRKRWICKQTMADL